MNEDIVPTTPLLPMSMLVTIEETQVTPVHKHTAMDGFRPPLHDQPVARDPLFVNPLVRPHNTAS